MKEKVKKTWKKDQRNLLAEEEKSHDLIQKSKRNWGNSLVTS